MKRWILPLLFAAGLAIAGTVNITDTYVFQAMFRPWSRTTAQLPTASAYTGYVAYDSTKGALSVSNGTSWVSSGVNVLGPFGTAYDFPALSPTNSEITLECARSWNVTATGAAVGDGCVAATIKGVDGGVGLPGAVHVDCIVTALNTLVFQICAQINDGGTINIEDAGYLARVFH